MYGDLWYSTRDYYSICRVRDLLHDCTQEVEVKAEGRIIAAAALHFSLAGCSFFQKGEAPCAGGAPTAPRLLKPYKVSALRKRPGEPEFIYPTFPPAHEPEVEHFLGYYQRRGRKELSDAFQRRKPYMRQINTILRQHGLPLELSNLAIIESGFKSDLGSGGEPAGIWQLVPATARSYGLSVNSARDERKLIVDATAAAARYFSDLFEVYGDWFLAVAAYNCGNGRLDRAIREAGTRDFFKLARSGALPQMTKEFVPRLLAISTIEKNPKKFGFDD